MGSRGPQAGDRAQLTLLRPTHPQVPVPRHSVGVVIGRSGEMIKKIQNDAGVRIQFINKVRGQPGVRWACGHVDQVCPLRSTLGVH